MNKTVTHAPVSPLYNHWFPCFCWSCQSLSLPGVWEKLLWAAGGGAGALWAVLRPQRKTQHHEPLRGNSTSKTLFIHCTFTCNTYGAMTFWSLASCSPSVRKYVKLDEISEVSCEDFYINIRVMTGTLHVNRVKYLTNRYHYKTSSLHYWH